MTAEREMKFEVDHDFVMPDLAGATGVHVEQRGPVDLRTTFYDTADLRLARWGCSLRFRRPDGWTVKLPATMDGPLVVRDEHVFRGRATVMPPEALDLVRGFARRAPLEPVAALRARRTVTSLLDDAGRPLAEVDDDEVSVLDGRRVIDRFHETEIELAPGRAEADLPSAVVEGLLAAGARASRTTKYRRALGEVAMHLEPEVAPPPRRVPSDATVHDVVRAALAASAIRMLQHDAEARIGQDPEGVHQARVAARRLRSDLRTFSPLLVASWTRGLRSELRWIGAELGAVRDADVLLARLRDEIAGLPAPDALEAKSLIDELERRRESAREDLLGEMRSERYLVLLDRVVAAACEPAVLSPVGERPAARAMGELMVRPWGRLWRSATALRPDSPDEALHGARIRAKRLRYAAEALVPVFGKPAKRFARGAEDLQEVLGEHQDAVVAAAWLRERAELAPDARSAFVAGRLVEREERRRETAREAWPRAWESLSARRRRFWT